MDDMGVCKVYVYSPDEDMQMEKKQEQKWTLDIGLYAG